MNRITEKRTRLLSMTVDEQARVFVHLIGHFGTLAETRPHHPAVSEFAQALDEASAAGDPWTHVIQERAARQLRQRTVESVGLPCPAIGRERA